MLKDIRFALRLFAKNPVFTFVAVVTLALGIGANTAIFSLVNSILLKPLPYRDPDQLVRVIQASPKLGLATWGVSQADFNAYREQNRSFEALAIYNAGGINLTGEGEPERLPVSNVTADFFKVLGVNPILGRAFQEGEDTAGRNDVCVISYGFWQRRFAADRNVVGRTLKLNQTPVQIVGVMPANFKFPRAEIDLWVPLAFDAKRGRAMQLMLFGVGAIDVLAFSTVSLLLLVAALLACWVPAWRASRVDPLVALRYE